MIIYIFSYIYNMCVCVDLVRELASKGSDGSCRLPFDATSSYDNHVQTIADSLYKMADL